MTLVAEIPHDVARRGRFAVVLEPWTYLSPALVIIATVLVVPLVIGISYSLRKFSAFRSEYVGLGQYRTMLGDEVLHGALFNTLWWTAGSLFFQFFLGLGLALLLNRPFQDENWCRARVPAWGVPTFLMSSLDVAVHRSIAPPHVFYASACGGPLTILADPATAMWGPIIAKLFGMPSRHSLLATQIFQPNSTKPPPSTALPPGSSSPR